MLRAMYRTFEIIGLSTSWLIRYDVSLVISAKLNNIHFTYIVNLDSIYIYIIGGEWKKIHYFWSQRYCYLEIFEY